MYAQRKEERLGRNAAAVVLFNMALVRVFYDISKYYAEYSSHKENRYMFTKNQKTQNSIQRDSCKPLPCLPWHS